MSADAAQAVAELKQRIDELEKRNDALSTRIGELESRIEELNSDNTAESRDSRIFDRYDRYVIEAAETDQRPTVAEQRRLYQEAGLVDRKKIKRRMKRLDRLEVWGE
jgi:cell division protein FtsB